MSSAAPSNSANRAISRPLSLPNSIDLEEFLKYAGFDSEWNHRLRGLLHQLHYCSGDWTEWQAEVGGILERKQSGVCPSRGLDWQVLALAQRMQELVVRHRKVGIEPAITAATVGDLSRWAGAIEKNSVPGRILPIHWFQNHLALNLLEVGCLQFVPGPAAAPARIFRRPDDPGEIEALACGGIPCDAFGWPTGDTPAFVTALEEDASGFVGHPILAETGSISAAKTVLERGIWARVFSPGDNVMHVHIPEGAVLSTAACRESFHSAKRVFGRLFPDLDWRVFYCTTWMLDPALDGLLEASSRIRQFAAEFRRVTMRHPNGLQIVERVLGNSTDWHAFTPKTSLQRKVCDFLREGGIFRTTSGYRLRKLHDKLHEQEPG